MTEHITDYDRLVEQQDQELALDGGISPFTQMQLQAYAEGRPITRIDVHSPEMERLTARLLHGAPPSDDDEWLWDEEVTL